MQSANGSGKEWITKAVNMQKNRAFFRKNFSLIELLIVIAIVAILAAMLLPALGQARKRAVGVSCLSQQKQLGIFFASYAGGCDEYVPPPKWHGNSWARLLKMYNEPETYTGYQWSGNWAPDAQKGYKSYKTYRCPAVEEGKSSDPSSPHLEVYGMNGSLSGVWQDWRSGGYNGTYWIKISQFGNAENLPWVPRKAPSQTILLADVHSTAPVTTGASPQYFFFSFTECRVILRHSGTANSLMVDGSARSNKIDGLRRAIVVPGQKIWDENILPITL